MKKIAALCLALLMLSLPACGNPSRSDGTEETVDPGHIPAGDEILELLEAGKGGLYWAVEEDFAWTGEVTVYDTVSYEGPLWDELFSGVEIISREERAYDDLLTASIDGMEYPASAGANAVSFYNMPGHPEVLDPEKVMEALSGIIGMDWEMDGLGAEEEIYYRCCLDGLPISRNGYFVGEDYYGGPWFSIDERHESTVVQFTLGASAGTIDAGKFVTPEEVKMICTAYWSFLNSVKNPSTVILDRVEHAYYYNAQQNKLLPAFIVTGAKYFISGRTGELTTNRVEHLIDAQTGELMSTVG